VGHSLPRLQPRGRHLACANREGSVKIWDPASGELTATLIGEQANRNSPRSLSFSPDGKLLACVASSGEIGIWNLATSQRERTMRAGSTQPHVFAVAFGPDSKWVGSGGARAR